MLNESDLIVAARAGDVDAFGDLVARHSGAARRAAMLLGAGDEADDMVQEALVKAYRRLSDYRGESEFRSWLVAIVSNETRNLHRSRRRRDEARNRAQALVEALRVEPELPDSAALANQERADLVHALRQLTAADRDVIAYRYLLGLSEAETAQLLQWPKGTVKSRTSRALAKLRSRLGVAIAVLVAATAIVVVPPAREAVAHLVSSVLRFAGIELVIRPAALPSATAAPFPSQRVVGLEEARALAPFSILVPAALPAPEQVVLGDPEPDGTPRVVSLRYPNGLVIDEFAGTFDLVFTKSVPGVVWLQPVEGHALWLPEAHELTYVDRSGVAASATTRRSGPVLIWQRGEVGIRIEGAASLDEALRISTSMLPAR